MSVYTAVSQSRMEEFLRCYDVGSLVRYEGINEGVENTNYFVDTDGAPGRYVLTLFEWQRPADLPYFLELMAHLAAAGLPCPHPVADRRGDCLQTLCEKPAALITRLAGRSVHAPDARHCEQVGAMLAKLHAAAAGFTGRHPDKRDGRWRRECSKRVLPFLSAADAEVLMDEISQHEEASQKSNGSELPRGTIHADLFRDNVLFDGGCLSGVIDFYYSCDGDLLYDLAVTVNDWCSNKDGSLDRKRYSALVDAYAERRPFSAAERDATNNAWGSALRRAALRFWLSRLRDTHFPKDGQITHVKDADAFRNILLHRRRASPRL